METRLGDVDLGGVVEETRAVPERTVESEGVGRDAQIWALATGAGKDATLALHRARRQGWNVRYAFCVYDGESDRVAFHGTRAALVEAHGRSQELEVLLDATSDTREYEEVFEGMLQALRERGVDGVIFGNVHLGDVRQWYEERTTAAGLLHREPLWDEDPAELVRELVACGYRALVVSVDLERGDSSWLGRELDLELIHEIEAHGADPCGEHGEYHTFVWDGPGFAGPIRFEVGRQVEMKGHRLLDLIPGKDASDRSGGLPGVS